MPNEKILVVDDQPEIVEPLRQKLEAEGFQVYTAGDGLTAVQRYSELRPDLVLLDVMLPRLDGFGVCRKIRSLGNTPILMLSARSEETQVVVGLELGADDYVTKPFRLTELVARIRALLRRPPVRDEVSEPETGRLMRVGDLTLDPVSHEVTANGTPITLTPVEFRLLSAFMRRPGEVFSREVLLETVWGYSGYDPALVNTHIKRLRSKIERDPANPTRLVAVRGFGYKLV